MVEWEIWSQRSFLILGITSVVPSLILEVKGTSNWFMGLGNI